MTKERTMRINRKYPTKREALTTFSEWIALGFKPSLSKPGKHWNISGVARATEFAFWCSVEAKREQSK